MKNIESLKSALKDTLGELRVVEERLRLVRKEALCQLPEFVGATSIDELIDMLGELASPEYRDRVRGPRKRTDASELQYSKPQRRKARVPITPEIREAVVKRTKDLKQTAGTISADLGISESAVNKIRMRAGLTKKYRA